MIKKFSRRLTRIPYYIRSLIYRRQLALMFAKTIVIDRSSRLQVGLSSRLLGGVFLENGSSIIAGENVILHSTSQLGVANGGIINIGDGCQIGRNIIINADKNHVISIGRETTFYGNSQLSGSIEIGVGVLFAGNINVFSSTHCINGRKPIRLLDQEYVLKYGAPPNDPVRIGDDCWIGMNAVILPGTILSNGCVIAAGAIVRGEYPEFAIIGGVPSKIIGYRNE